jgi:8-oxo-dGTP pyrophosphatase MutT (NUDIX family)
MDVGKRKKRLEFSASRNIGNFIASLQEQLGTPLPGVVSQLKLAPVHRLSELLEDPPLDAVKSSVLLLLYPKANKLYSNVILRAEYDGIHSGQISLPGGRMEETDHDHLETALREANEETGIDISTVKILGSLSRLYINRSNYVVFPFVGYTDKQPNFLPDPLEVQEIIEFEISDLYEPNTLVHKTLHFKNGFSITAPGFQIGDHFMWGATAMIFNEFLDIVGSIID